MVNNVTEVGFSKARGEEKGLEVEILKKKKHGWDAKGVKGCYRMLWDAFGFYEIL